MILDRKGGKFLKKRRIMTCGGVRQRRGGHFFLPGIAGLILEDRESSAIEKKMAAVSFFNL